MTPRAACLEERPIELSLTAEAAQYSAAYERLRACIIGEDSVPSSRACAPSLGLVLQEGVPGWLKACAHVHPASTPAPPDERRHAAVDNRAATAALAISPELLPVAQQMDLTLLLANLVASVQRTRRGRSMPASIPQTVLRAGAA